MTRVLNFAGDPAANPDLAPFWDACRQRLLLLRTCNACRRPHWYPRAICPHCFSQDLAWTEAAGTGTIYTYSHMLRVPQPYVIGYVALAEGTTMLTNIVDCDPASLRIGQPVRLAFAESDAGVPLPVFAPA